MRVQKQQVQSKSSLTKKLGKTLKRDGKEVLQAAKHLTEDATSTLSKSSSLPSLPSLPKLPSLPSSSLPVPTPVVASATASKEEATESKANDVKIRKKPAMDKDSHRPLSIIRKPAIFFISGLSLFSSSGDGEGVEKMSSYLRGSEHFSWKQKEDMITEIKRRPLGMPVVLVGHSLGGDTAVEIANELNSLENGFRKVDLLVTLDSVGFNNDIIPQNVAVNYNFITDEDSLFNDGPNIAKNVDLTKVINELREEGHTSIDNSEDVQFKIFKAIEHSLAESAQKRIISKDQFSEFANIHRQLGPRRLFDDRASNAMWTKSLLVPSDV